MPALKRSRRKRMHDWAKIEQWTLWPERQLYEQLRPILLFGETAGERAKETGAAQRTPARKADDFEQHEMLSLFSEDQPLPDLDEKRLMTERWFSGVHGVHASTQHTRTKQGQSADRDEAETFSCLFTSLVVEGGQVISTDLSSCVHGTTVPLERAAHEWALELHVRTAPCSSAFRCVPRRGEWPCLAWEGSLTGSLAIENGGEAAV